VKRISMLALGALLVVAPTLASMPSAVSSTRGVATPDLVAGSYKVFYNWNHVGFRHTVVTLDGDHTGTDSSGHAVTWSRAGRIVTFTISAPPVEATYIGTKNHNGFSSKQNPGTITNSLGDNGVWYAVKGP
jgi:hypothetical protein